jgi:hypothetical protein
VVFTHVYRQQMTDATFWAYNEALKDLTPDQLERGCIGAMKVTRFTPTPAEIREHISDGIEPPALNAIMKEAPLSIEELREMVKEAKKRIQ